MYILATGQAAATQRTLQAAVVAVAGLFIGAAVLLPLSPDGPGRAAKILNAVIGGSVCVAVSFGMPYLFAFAGWLVP